MTQTTKDTKTIVLFDVDGTLTQARGKVTPEVLSMLKELRKRCYIGFVGGSDIAKQREQLGDDVLDLFDYAFSENGLCAWKDGQPLASQTFAAWLGEKKLGEFTNFVLGYLSKLELPVKRGTFVEFRTGMLNVSPIGRNCSRPERNAYEEYDLKHGIREKMVAALEERFAGWGLKFSIGGQISFDVFPQGWDKTYCLKFLEPLGLESIHFFGDKTYKGGNDYEIYTHDGVQGHAVKTPADTLRIVRELWLGDEGDASSRPRKQQKI
jgi:phosphomannomutase